MCVNNIFETTKNFLKEVQTFSKDSLNLNFRKNSYFSKTYGGGTFCQKVPPHFPLLIFEISNPVANPAKFASFEIFFSSAKLMQYIVLYVPRPFHILYLRQLKAFWRICNKNFIVTHQAHILFKKIDFSNPVVKQHVF